MEKLVAGLAAHPEIGLRDYQRVQRMVNEGEIYEQGEGRLALIFRDGDADYRGQCVTYTPGRYERLGTMGSVLSSARRIR